MKVSFFALTCAVLVCMAQPLPGVQLAPQPDLSVLKTNTVTRFLNFNNLFHNLQYLSDGNNRLVYTVPQGGSMSITVLMNIRRLDLADLDKINQMILTAAAESLDWTELRNMMQLNKGHTASLGLFGAVFLGLANAGGVVDPARLQNDFGITAVQYEEIVSKILELATAENICYHGVVANTMHHAFTGALASYIIRGEAAPADANLPAAPFDIMIDGEAALVDQRHVGAEPPADAAMPFPAGNMDPHPLRFILAPTDMSYCTGDN